MRGIAPAAAEAAFRVWSKQIELEPLVLPAAYFLTPSYLLPASFPACPFTLHTAVGRKRFAHVFLPDSYDGSKKFPLWVHLHGVFWATMSNVAEQVMFLFRVPLYPLLSTLY